MTLDVAWAERWTRLSAERIAAARDELTELDRQIGDGDHGENLDRGFRAVVAKLDGAAAGEQPPGQIGDVLKLVATTLMSSVGGASGPLYGTAYLRAAKVTGLAELDAHGVVALLEGALEGISARGKAQVGEKTMVDAWQPAVDAAEARRGGGVARRPGARRHA
ncbi:dihydroxyacetone kinase, partial [Cellulosimicrobium sp. MM]